MKKKWAKRLIASFLIAVLLIPSIAVLAIAPPDAPTPTIDGITVYRDCVETDDWLYVIEYTITYGAPPAENIEEAFIFRIMDGVVELKSGLAYAYNADGYDNGIVGIYFSAAEVAAAPTVIPGGLVWLTTYMVKIEGNPTLTWTGTGCPSNDSDTYTNWHDPMGNELGSDVLTLAIGFTSSWGGNALFISQGATVLLSGYGEDYFSTSIPNLMTMQPHIFISSVSSVQYPPERDHPLTYAASLDYTYWTGTWLDLTTVATDLAIPPTFLYGSLWFIVMLGAMIGVIFLTKTFEPLIIVAGLLLVFGALLHFIPLLIPIIVGAILVILGVFSVLYKPSYG